MQEPVYKKIEITGTSTKTMEGAVENAIARADESLDKLRWFEVTEIRGNLDGGKIDHWQVTLKVGFTLQNVEA